MDNEKLQILKHYSDFVGWNHSITQLLNIITQQQNLIIQKFEY